MKKLTSLGNGLRGLSAISAGLMIAAAFGASACNEGDSIEASGVDPELGVNFDELGAALPNCTAATSAEFNATTKVLALSVPDATDAVISVVNGKLKVNGNQCQTTAGLDLTSTNVTRINVTAVDNAKVVVDMLPGSFGNIFSGTGGIVITGTTGNLSVGVRGTATANLVKMSEASSAYYLELSGDTRADLKVVPSAGTFPPISLALGEGADSFTAQGPSLTITALGTGTQSEVNASQPLTVFGGGGNDTLKGGLGDDTLNGGDGNDILQTNATTASLTEDGADVYVGGAGTDTVDYSGRTTAVSVSVAPTVTNGWVKTSVSIFNASIADQQTLIYQGSGAATTVTFGANDGDPVVGAEAILAAIGTPVGATVRLNDRGELIFERDDAGSMAITGGTAAAALFGAATVSNNGTTALYADANDGLSGEGDDVRADVENITGGTADDVLTGSESPNLINGGGGNDSIAGGVGGTCSGSGSDTDTLNGGDGNDIFEMGFASNCSDILDGGAGTDHANYEMRTVALVVDIDGTGDDGEPSEADNIKTTVEGVLGGEGDDLITGSTAADDLHGGLGADTLVGGSGADSLTGGLGVDSLIGGVGEDYFNEKDTADSKYVKASNIAGDGGDLINGGADVDTGDFARAATMTVTLCTSTNITGAGACVGDTANNDTDDGDDLTNVEHFVGGAGDDSIVGATGDDLIEGGDGADTISGGTGNDTLYGEGGDDELDGGAGEDTLDGAAGTNTLVGGAGDDLCTIGGGGVVDETCEI